MCAPPLSGLKRASRGPAAQREGGGRCGLLRPTLRPHARRPVLALEHAGEAAAALRRRAASAALDVVGLYESRHGVLAAAVKAGAPSEITYLRFVVARDTSLCAAWLGTRRRRMTIGRMRPTMMARHLQYERSLCEVLRPNERSARPALRVQGLTIATVCRRVTKTAQLR